MPQCSNIIEAARDILPSIAAQLNNKPRTTTASSFSLSSTSVLSTTTPSLSSSIRTTTPSPSSSTISYGSNTLLSSLTTFLALSTSLHSASIEFPISSAPTASTSEITRNTTSNELSLILMSTVTAFAPASSPTIQVVESAPTIVAFVMGSLAALVILLVVAFLLGEEGLGNTWRMQRRKVSKQRRKIKKKTKGRSLLLSGLGLVVCLGGYLWIVLLA